MKKAPTWGRTIGILMIIFGAFGVFIQIYKVMMPNIIRMQNRMMNSMTLYDDNNFNNNPFLSQQNRVMNEMFYMNETQANILVFTGYLGLIFCVLYIVGGARLLKAKPSNYNFAFYTLIGFCVFNLISVILLASTGSSLMVMGILVYVILGLVSDIVFVIIAAASDKSGYGIGEGPEKTTLDSGNNSYTYLDNDIE